jgi:hypothetical protein
LKALAPVAKLWLTYREGLRLLGAPVGDVALEPAVARLDIAPWRFYSAVAPETRPLDEVRGARERKRLLLEVVPTDRYELCGLTVGFYESPYSLQECSRRLGLGNEATSPRP